MGVKKSKWPKTVRDGSVTVTVYRIPHPKTAKGFVFAVAWYPSPGRRLQRQFTDEGQAMAEARLRAAQIAAGRVGALSTVNSDDVQVLTEARRLAGDVPVLAALAEWNKARTLAGADIVPACESWANRHNGAALSKITVADAIAQFLKDKKRNGVDVSRSYTNVLKQLGDAMGTAYLPNVTPGQLGDYLARIRHPASRNTHRKRIVTLWRWSRKKHLLPADVETAADRTERAREGAQEIGTITPSDFRAVMRILAEEHKHYVPAAVLAGLCGMRRGEIHAQDWSGIELEREFVRVTSAKKGTPARRLIPLPAAAIAWLMPYRKANGPICDNLAIDRIRDIARTAGYDLADNGFRHTWISARVAVTGDIPRTSIEAGNSPTIIRRHYLELMTKEEGAEWFEVGPDGNIVIHEVVPKVSASR